MLRFKIENILTAMGYGSYLCPTNYRKNVCNGKFELVIYFKDFDIPFDIYQFSVRVNGVMTLKDLEKYKFACAQLIADLKLLKEVIDNV